MTELETFTRAFVLWCVKPLGISTLPHLPANVSLMIAWVVCLGLVVSSYVWGSSVFEQRRLQYTMSAFEASKYGHTTLAYQLVGEAEKQIGAPLPKDLLWTIFPEEKLAAELAAIQTLLQTQPTYVPGLLQKAQILLQLKRDAEAMEVLLLLEQLDPNTPSVRTALKTLYSSLPASASSAPLP